jgi:hypothetical protein
MWSLRCLLMGHDDTLLRRPYRLSLQCSHCGRQTRGWSLNRSQSGGSPEQVGVRREYRGRLGRQLGHGLAFNWGRRLLAFVSRTAPDEG